MTMPIISSWLGSWWSWMEWGRIDVQLFSLLSYLMMVWWATMMPSQKMLNNILSSLPYSVENTHRISHEYRMNHILLQLLDILLLDGSLYSLIINCHFFILITLLLVLWVMHDSLLLRLLLRIWTSQHGSIRHTRELAISIVVICILILVEKVFNSIIEIVAKCRVLVPPPLFFRHIGNILRW